MPSSNVLSYFRANHKRNSSDPATLSPTHSLDNSSLQTAEPAPPLSAPRLEASALPALPPIPRVASRYGQSNGEESASPVVDAESPPSRFKEPRPNGPARAQRTAPPQHESLAPPTLNIPYDPNLSSASASPSPIVLSSSSDGRSSPSFRPPAPSKSPVLGHHRSSKTRLNLLNPMALLMRRRSPQALEYLSDPGGNRNLTVPAMPDNFDPRIRGTHVHDFNAPRPARNRSFNELANPAVSVGRSDREADDGKKLPEKERTPVFKEHFDDPIAPTEAHPDDQLYMDDNTQKALPPFARRLPPTVSEAVRRSYVEDQDLVKGTILVEDMVPNDQSTAPNALESAESIPNSKKSQSSRKDKSRVSSLSDQSYQPAGLPRHMTSNASRFSFDLAGVGSSAQEKLLEEKHRAKALASRSNHDPETESLLDEDGDLYDIDDFDDGGFEERIPGVNADADEDDDFYNVDDVGDDDGYDDGFLGSNIDIEDDDPTIKPNMEGFDFQIQQKDIGSPTNLSNHSLGPVSTPRDLNGQAIGFAESKESPEHHNQAREIVSSQTPLTPESMSPESQRVSGLGLIGFSEDFSGLYGQSMISPPPSQNGSGLPTQTPPQFGSDDDDLYFDDGMIGHPPTGPSAPFDESWFDNEADDLDANPVRMAPLTYGTTRHGSLMDQSRLPNPLTSQALLSQTLGPETSKISEYHKALAAAATAAEANGAFDRAGESASPRVQSLSEDQISSLPGFTNVEDLPYDFSDDLEDDPIIAEANAEALANDSDGFYGQEFNFYSTSATDSPYTNGGYFCNPSELSHQNSTRQACREPNLTPITERSETSNRNSIASSFYLSGSAAAPGTSPITNLAQLQTMLSSPTAAAADDESMSYAALNSALKKLRRGAFGGSSGSLRSSGTGQSPISGSPLTHLPPSSAFSPTAHQHSMASLSNSTTDPLAASLLSNGSSGSGRHISPESEPGSSPSSSPLLHFGGNSAGNSLNNSLNNSITSNQSRPKLAQASGINTATSASASPVPASAVVSSSSDSSPIKRGTPWKKGHSRAGSGTGEKESVSYRREEGEESGWVIEKRRMSATGEMEVVGLERVEEGRI